MRTRIKVLVNWIPNFKTKLFEEGKKRALDIKKIKEEARIDLTK